MIEWEEEADRRTKWRRSQSPPRTQRSIYRSKVSPQVASELSDLNLEDAHRRAIVADLERVIMRYPVKKLATLQRELILMARVLADSYVQETRVVKFLFRLMVQNREAWQTQLILDLCQTRPDSLLPGLRELQDQFKRYRVERATTAAYPASYRRALLQFMGYLFGDRPAPLLELVEPDAELTTYTDGARIYLPNRIDLATGESATRTNVGLMYHSIVHEALHLGIKGHRGTYEFSFETPMGALLLQRLRPFRQNFDRNQLAWEGEHLFRRIAQEEGLDVEGRRPVLTDLVAFYMFAKHQRLLQFLLNVFEDIRIERIIQGSGFREFSLQHAELAIRQWSHPRLQDPEQQLTQFLLQEMVGGGGPRQLPASLMHLKSEICSKFAHYHSIDVQRMSPEASAVLAWDLYVFLKDNIPRSSAKQMDENLRPRATPTEISIRRQLLSFGQGMPGGSGRPTLFRRKQKPADGPSVYDEFDHTEGHVVGSATQVVVKNFAPKRTPYPAGALRMFQMPSPNTMADSAQSSKANFRFEEHGEYIEMDRVIPAMSAIRAGRAYDRRLYRTRKSEMAKPLVSVLIDLTVSMEQRRAGMEARSIQLAIDATKRIYQASRDEGFDLQVFGVLDGGRQPVNMYRVALSDIEKIHCLGLGGARMGAAVRHLANQGHQDREHQIFIFTDDSGSYLRYGNDELVGSVWKNCAGCQLRRLAGKGCHVELGKKGEPRSGAFYESMEYQYADLDHAIRTIPANNSVYYVEFAPKPYSHLLNFYLPGRWWNSTGALDLSVPAGSRESV